MACRGQSFPPQCGSCGYPENRTCHARIPASPPEWSALCSTLRYAHLFLKASPPLFFSVCDPLVPLYLYTELHIPYGCFHAHKQPEIFSGTGRQNIRRMLAEIDSRSLTRSAGLPLLPARRPSFPTRRLMAPKRSVLHLCLQSKS